MSGLTATAEERRIAENDCILALHRGTYRSEAFVKKNLASVHHFADAVGWSGRNPEMPPRPDA